MTAADTARATAARHAAMDRATAALADLAANVDNLDNLDPGEARALGDNFRAAVAELDTAEVDALGDQLRTAAAELDPNAAGWLAEIGGREGVAPDALREAFDRMVAPPGVTSWATATYAASWRGPDLPELLELVADAIGPDDAVWSVIATPIPWDPDRDGWLVRVTGPATVAPQDERDGGGA